MFEDASGDVWEVRLLLSDLSRLRLDGCLDANELLRGGDLRAWLDGPLASVLRAGWLLARAKMRFAEWVDRCGDPEAVLRLKASLALAVMEFLPEPMDDNSEESSASPDRRGEWVERLGWELAAIAGMDGGHTLRELAWGARERRRFAGELAAWHMANIVARIPFAGTPPNPTDVNPYRIVKAKSKELIELERWQAEQIARARAGLPVIPKGR